MLSFANIRKTKGQTFSLFIMFLITALLLNAGLLVFIDFGSYFQKTTQELNTSDTYFLMPGSFYSKQVRQSIKNNSAVLKMQKENSMLANVSIPYNGDKWERTFLFNDADASRGLSKWKFDGAHLAPDSMSIYLPYVLSADGGYKLNEKIKITVKNTVLTFTIKGFTEDAFFSSPDTGPLGVYLPHKTWVKVEKRLGGQYDAALVFVNLSKTNNSIEAGIKDIVKRQESISSSDLDNSISTVDLPLIKSVRTLMASIVSAMSVAFAAVIAIVCLIVIRFRIGNSIEDDMVKIGSLKAMGYTSGQIVSSVVLQFVLIAFVGSAAGILLSYLTTPVLSAVFVHQSGFMWVQGFDGLISGITLCAILLVVVLVSLLAARRIHRLTPIVALRGGIVTHSFKKNYFPLNRSQGSLPVVFALKSIFQNGKSSMMIAVILAFVGFSSAFSVVMFYNSAVDTTNFATIPGVELSNAETYLSPTADSAKIVKEIKAMKGVRKVQFLDNSAGTVDGTNADIFIMDGYAQKETNTVYAGRYPRHDNEIAVSGVLADSIQKRIGDTVTLKISGKKVDYLITGLSQGSSYGGVNVYLTRAGMLKLNPNFKQQILEIYTNKGVGSDKLIKRLNGKFGKLLLQTVNMDEEFQQGMGMYTDIVSKVGVAMFVINILVVILVLYFVINSSIVRKKRELGIQKAIGFTTVQLMNQISLGFLPPIILGVIVGSLLGITQTNAIMSVVQRSMCIMKANYIITPGWIGLFGVAIVIVSYLTSLLITYRIREISAYSLVSE
jgi:Predicted ABC-type transport system involved in lysophospholipase L1 biosynthesis, permease component